MENQEILFKQQNLKHNGICFEVPIELTDKQRLHILEIQNSSPMLVFYGFAKLTPKIVRKRSIIILYENTNHWNEKKEKFINQKMNIVHVRIQNEEEALQGKSSNQEFHRFEIFVDDKRYKGNLDKALEHNFLVDAGNVSEFERQHIRYKLKKEYHSFYKISSKPAGQQSIIFY